MDGVGGVGGKDHVAGVQHGEAEMGEAFLGSYGGDGLGIRIEMHVESAGIQVTDSLTQVGNAAGNGIAVVYGFAGGLAQLVYDEPGGGQIGVAHGKVHDVDVLLAELLLDVPHHGKGVGGAGRSSKIQAYGPHDVGDQTGRTYPSGAGMTSRG